MAKNSFISEIARGLSIASAISGYIIGPLILFGAVGYGIDIVLQSGKKALVISLVLSFIVSNVLILKNASKIMSKLSDKNNTNKPDSHGN